MENKQLTLEEKWQADIESYKRCGGMKVTTPQCKKCKYWIKANALNCMKYEKSKKPSYVLSAVKECPEFKSADKIAISIKSDTESRLKGGLWGAITADALGVPVEFSDRNSRKKDPVKEMRAYGTYHQPFGTWSDDTSMLMCLVESISEGFSLEKLSEKFVAFAENGHMTPYGVVFDIGNAVSRAITNIKAGINPIECGGISEYDNGNGSLMRILPLAFYLKDSSATELIKTVTDVSAITHRHPISVLACIFYVKMAIELFNGKDKSTAYKSAAEFVITELSTEYQPTFKVFERILNGKIDSEKEKNINSSGYVVDSLEAAVWCFLNTKSYSECVFSAINLGGDTDTIACIAGGLAGIYYGLESISDN